MANYYSEGEYNPMGRKWNGNNGNNAGTYYDSYQWVNNNSGDIWKPTPGNRGDFQPGYRAAPNDGREAWGEDPRLQEWTKTPVKSGQSKPSRKPAPFQFPRPQGEAPSGNGTTPTASYQRPDVGNSSAGYTNSAHQNQSNSSTPYTDDFRNFAEQYGSNSSSSSPSSSSSSSSNNTSISRKSTGVAPEYSEYNHDSSDPDPNVGLDGNTYVGRGWADYWNRSIPETDPNWSDRFRNQHAKFANENRVIDRSALAQRIEKRAQYHSDKGDYLSFLNRGENRGENKANWVQPEPIKADDQPEVDIEPFLDRIHQVGQQK